MPAAEFDAFSRLLGGQYALEREIGRGGMGVVYLARDLKLDRPVAIKTLPPHLAADAVIRERFLREARTAAALSHPNIVPIYRADEIDGHVFFAMAWVDGPSVAERVAADGPLDAREVRRVMHDVALALGFAHAHGIVHRDVKAENILIERDSDAAKVTDFGIARLAEATPLTATGQVLGSVYYMSPEQVQGAPLDGRSDLYSLGVVGFFALTGRFPFDAGVASAVLVAHVTKPAPPVLSVAPDAPRALAEIVDRCLAKDPAARFQSGAELAEALAHAAADVERDAAGATPVARAPRVVSDTEAQVIWSRAAALQAMTGVAPRPAVVATARDERADASRTTGYSLDQVRDAAAEAGIPSQYVDHALAERGLVAAPDTRLPTRSAVTDLRPAANALAGGPMSVELEAVIPGEMPERDFDVLVETIRRRLGQAGAVTAMGRSITWNTISKGRSVHVSVLSRSGRTTVRAVEDMGPLAGGLFGGLLGGGGGGFTGAAIGIGLGVFHSPAAAIAVEAVWLGCVYGLARGIFGNRSRKRKQTLAKLVEELAAQVTESIGAGSVADAAPPTTSPFVARRPSPGSASASS